MLIKKPGDIRPSEITPDGVYLRRREFVKAGLIALAGAAGLAATDSISAQGAAAKLAGVRKSNFSTMEQPNSYKEITSYNNYYEFGTEKSDPAEYAHKLRTHPWTVVVEGEVKRPKTFAIEDLLKLPLEERIYRMRCVEGWSMVIPCVGFE